MWLGSSLRHAGPWHATGRCRTLRDPKLVGRLRRRSHGRIPTGSLDPFRQAIRRSLGPDLLDSRHPTARLLGQLAVLSIVPSVVSELARLVPVADEPIVPMGVPSPVDEIHVASAVPDPWIGAVPDPRIEVRVVRVQRVDVDRIPVAVPVPISRPIGRIGVVGRAGASDEQRRGRHERGQGSTRKRADSASHDRGSCNRHAHPAQPDEPLLIGRRSMLAATSGALRRLCCAAVHAGDISVR